MKNVKNAVRLCRISKSGAFSLIVLFFGIAGSSFKSLGEPDPINSRDSLLTDKSGFKSLFSASYFDPSKPYVTQINPKAVSFVQKYILEEGANLEKMKVWGKPYFDMYDGIFNQYGLPKELKYLSVIESSLVSNIMSPAGAVGPWQIMPDEARSRGLRINSSIDERTNVYKSTHAAAKILKELHTQFSDWLLVIAAYNCGDGRLRQAIRKSGSRNFWDLQYYLPEETRNHVKRFIGTHYIFEGSGGLTTMTASEVHDFKTIEAAPGLNKNALNDPEHGSIEVSGKFKSHIIAKNLGISLSTFNRLNPNFDRMIGQGKAYNMTLPIEKINVFSNIKNAILEESINFLLNS
ncbi:MAG TPA: lytic transglycosylase domain-containing protein [Segetibacter sp.]|jgi:membrane-bound lytic murein transglycosylase D